MAKTYYSVPDKAASDTFTEAMWDDFIRTNINNLRVRPMCRLSRTAGWSVISHNNWATLEWDTEDYDTDAMCSSGGGGLITVKTAGIYILTAQFTADSQVETNEVIRDLYLGFTVNGTGDHGHSCLLDIDGTVNTNTARINATATYELAVNDVLRARVFIGCAAAGSQALLSNANAHFAATWQGQLS